MNSIVQDERVRSAARVSHGDNVEEMLGAGRATPLVVLVVAYVDPAIGIITFWQMRLSTLYSVGG